MKYFPSSESEVTILFEVLWHRHNIGHALPDLVLADVAPGGVGSPPGEEGGPAGSTERHLGVGVGRHQTTACQLVQAGGFHLGRTEVVALTQHSNVRSDNISDQNFRQFQLSSYIGKPPSQLKTYLKSSAMIKITFLCSLKTEKI